METDQDEVSEDLIFNIEKDNTLINFNGYQIKPVAIIANTDNKIIDDLLLSELSYHPIISLLIFIFSLTLGILSALPLINYGKNIKLETLFDEVICIIRTIYGTLIFTGLYYDIISVIIQFLFGKKVEQQDSIIKNNFFTNINKTLIITLFATIYSLPYAWNYWILPETLLPYLTVPLYFLILSRIFYQRANIQFGVRADSSEVNRKKNILIASVKRTLTICKENYNASTILTNINTADVKHSLLFTVKNDHMFYQHDKEDLTNRYENDIYDKWEISRTNLLNIFLGIIYISLLITLINQYESLMVDIAHSLNITTNHQIHGILWGSTWVAIVEAALFILATYNIHHNYLRKIILAFNIKICKQKLIKLLLYSPIIAAGIILAMTRLESSYIAFAKLATVLLLTKDLGYFLITMGMALSFLVEMTFMIKTSIYVFNNTMRSILTSSLIPTFICNNEYFKQKRDLAQMTILGKKIIAIINNMTDDCILRLMKNILQR